MSLPSILPSLLCLSLVQNTNIFYKILQQQTFITLLTIMLRCDLKRSTTQRVKINFNNNSRLTVNQQMPHSQTFRHTMKQAPKKPQFAFYMPSMLSGQAKPKNQQNQNEIQYICPLKCWSLSYPTNVQQIISQSTTQRKQRLVGCQLGIYYLFSQSTIHLWRYDCPVNPTNVNPKVISYSKIDYKSKVDDVAFGYLNKNEVYANIEKNQYLVILIASGKSIEVCSLDLKTLRINFLDMRIWFSSKIQKIKFHDHGQLYISRSGGFLTFVDLKLVFGKKYHQSSPKQSMFDRKVVRMRTQRIVVGSSNIYVLVEKQIDSFFLTKIFRKVVNYLKGIYQPTDVGKIQKQIHLYKVDRTTKKLKYGTKITSYEIQNFIQAQLSQQEIKEFRKSWNQIDYENNKYKSIKSISILKKHENLNQEVQRLSVATLFGNYLTISVDMTKRMFAMDERSKKIPAELHKGLFSEKSNIFLLKPDYKKYMKENNQLSLSTRDQSMIESELNGKDDEILKFLNNNSTLVESFGEDNLNLADNGLFFYFDQKEIQVAKIEEFHGVINEVEAQQQSSHEKSRYWVNFTKSNIIIIKKSELKQLIVTTILGVNNNTKFNEKSKDLYSKMQVRKMGQVIGNEEIIRSLSDLLLETIRIEVDRARGVTKLKEPFFLDNMIKVATEYSDRVYRNGFIKKNTINVDKLKSLFWYDHQANSMVSFVPIQGNLKQLLEKILILYSISRVKKISEEKGLMEQEGNKQLQDMVPFLTQYIVQIFNNLYGRIKKMGPTQIRMLVSKVRETTLYLKCLKQFIQDKRKREENSIKDILKFNEQDQQASTEPYTIQPNTVSTNITTRIYQPRNDRVQFGYIKQIQNQVCRCIDMVVKIIPLYENIVAKMGEPIHNLPTLQDFFTHYESRKVVKNHLLKLFTPDDEYIVSQARAFPELGLSSDIYITKWLKSIESELDNQMQIYENSSNPKIHGNQLIQLSRHINFQHIQKLQNLFKKNPGKMLQLLIHCLSWKQNKLSQMPKFNPVTEQFDNRSAIFLTEKNIFDQDRKKVECSYTKQLESQVQKMENAIKKFMEGIVQKMKRSTHYQYIYYEKLLIGCAQKILHHMQEEGKTIITHLIVFMSTNNYFPEKVNQLRSMIGVKLKTKLSDLISKAKKPLAMMSNNQMLDQQMNSPQLQYILNFANRQGNRQPNQ